MKGVPGPLPVRPSSKFQVYSGMARTSPGTGVVKVIACSGAGAVE